MPLKKVRNARLRARATASPYVSAVDQLPAGMSRDSLYALWKRSIRGNRQAQDKLVALVRVHPGLETLLKAFAGDRDAVLRVRAETLGTDASGAERALTWEPKRRQGPWVSVVAGGLPGLGKRR